MERNLAEQTCLNRLLNGGKDAGDVFAAAFSKTDSEEKSAALSVIQKNPEIALARLQNYEDTRLTLRGGAEALDLILEAVTPEEARRIMEAHLTHPRRIELLSGRGELASVVIQVCDPAEAFQAMILDVFGNGRVMSPTALTLVQIRAWAMKLMDRLDYDDILEMPIRHHTFKEWLILLLASENDEVSLDQYDDLGIDPDEGSKILSELKQKGRLLHTFDVSEIASARVTFAKQKKEKEAAKRLSDEIEI
jgi:hypothetical protein